MKITLDIKDRIILIQNMPEQRPVEAMILIEKISISEEEKESYGYAVSDNKITWNTSIDTNKEFDMSIEEISFINNILDNMNKVGFADMSSFQTYKKLKSL